MHFQLFSGGSTIDHKRVGIPSDRHPSGDIVTYAYNGDGLRVWQDDGVDEVRYVHDGNNVLLETDGVGTVEAEFTYIPQVYVEGSVFGFQF